MSTSSSSSLSMAGSDTTVSTSPTTSTASSVPSTRKATRSPPWIVYHISEATIPCELPLRIMFSFNSGQKLPMLKDVNHYWHYASQGKLISQFLSSVGQSTPAAKDASLAHIQYPQPGLPETTINSDHAEGDRFMDPGNAALLNIDFAKLAGDDSPTTKTGLPALVIKNTCRRIFTKEYEKVQFSQALTGLDYLRDMELTRRGKLRDAATRLGISLYTWKQVLQDNPDALRWLELLQKYELVIEEEYANVFIDIRIWTMLAELKEMPFNKPSVLAMLNTLFPPSVQELPNDRIQAKALHQYRSIFFRYITAVEKNGNHVLQGFEDTLQRQDNRHNWTATWENMQDYMALADLMVQQAEAVISLGIDIFLKGDYTFGSPLGKISPDERRSWWSDDSSDGEIGTFEGPRSLSRTPKLESSFSNLPLPKFGYFSNDSLRSLLSAKFRSRTNLPETAISEHPPSLPRRDTADSTMSSDPPSLTRTDTFETATTVSPTLSGEWPSSSATVTARSSYSASSPDFASTDTPSSAESISTAKANPARSSRAVPSLPKLDTDSIRMRQRAVSKAVMPFDTPDSPAAIHEAFSSNIILPTPKIRDQERQNIIAEVIRPSTSHVEASPRFGSPCAGRPSTSNTVEKPFHDELNPSRSTSFYDERMDSPSMPLPLTLGGATTFKLEQEKEKPLPSDGGAFLNLPYTEPSPPLEKSLKKKSSFGSLFSRNKSVENLALKEQNALGISTSATPAASETPARPIKPIIKTSKSMSHLPRAPKLTVDTSVPPVPVLRSKRSFGESLREKFNIKSDKEPPLPSPKTVAFSPKVSFCPDVLFTPPPEPPSKDDIKPIIKPARELVKPSMELVKRAKVVAQPPVVEKAPSIRSFPSNIFTEPARDYKIDTDPVAVIRSNKEKEAEEAAIRAPRMPLNLHSPHFATFPDPLPPRHLLPGPDPRLNALVKEQAGISYFDSDENDMYKRNKLVKLKKESRKKRVEKVPTDSPSPSRSRSDSNSSATSVETSILDLGYVLRDGSSGKKPMEPVVMTSTEDRLGPILRDFKIMKATEPFDQDGIVAEGGSAEYGPSPEDLGLEPPKKVDGVKEMLRARSMPNLKKNVLKRDKSEKKAGMVSKEDISAPLELDMEENPGLLQDECKWNELENETRSKEWSRKWVLEQARAKKYGFSLDPPARPSINTAFGEKKMKLQLKSPVLENGDKAEPKRVRILRDGEKARPPSFEDPRATPKPMYMPWDKRRRVDTIFELPPPPVQLPPPPPLPPIGSKKYEQYLKAYKERQARQGM